MKLSETYRPASLAQIVGQPAADLLAEFSADPYPTCWALVGRPGIGKTASALALASDLGCPDEFSGLSVVAASELGVSEVRALLDTVRLRPMLGSGWRVVVIEELERLSQQATILLKVALSSENLPARVVWVATSNDVSKVDPALFERFTALDYLAGESLAAATLPRLESIWRVESAGAPAPAGLEQFGWRAFGDELRFSVRAALDELQTELIKLRGRQRRESAAAATH